jgi:predicted ribosome quality control (RQC) complex YloA/Tae2 family protein
MKVEISLSKSVEENAGIYFDRAKKNKKKLEGVDKALKVSRDTLARLLAEEDKFLEKEKVQKEAQKRKEARKKEWYHKFHWFHSSEGFLCVGGKDATSNEILVKKHTEKDDIVFHTDMAGSPFFIVKGGVKSSEATREECAQVVACYSRGWKQGLGTMDVFWVKPDQVTKEAQSGEHLAKGSFMVYGKTTYLHPRIEFAIGLKGEEIIGGAVKSIESTTPHFVIIVPGREKKSALAKKILKKFGAGDLDDIISCMPAGGAEIKKVKKKR